MFSAVSVLLAVSRPSRHGPGALFRSAPGASRRTSRPSRIESSRIGSPSESANRSALGLVRVGTLVTRSRIRRRALPVWGCPSRPSLREAPGRWCWSRWSARSAARTNDLDHPEGWCRLSMGRSAAAWGLPALPGCSTNVVSSATTIGIGCPPQAESAVASVLYGRPARKLAGTLMAGADRGGNP